MMASAVKEQCADCCATLSSLTRGNRYQNEGGEDICDPCHHAQRRKREELDYTRQARGQYGSRQVVAELTLQGLRRLDEATAEQLAQHMSIPYRTCYRRLVALRERGLVRRRRNEKQVFSIGNPPYLWSVI